MIRLKPLLVVAAVGAALISLVRNRLAEPEPVDAGGWKPVEPA
jgi:hypothetical protein